MRELSFRGAERYRSLVWIPVWILGGGLTLGLPIAYFQLGNGESLCVVAIVGAAVTGVGILKVRRSWTKVGSAGITICQGIGWRGRIHPWQEIRWIDIRQTTGQRVGTRYTVRIALSNGRRRTLPALAHSNSDPDPHFYRDVARIKKWWELNTDPTTRCVPPDTQLSRRAPTVLGTILILLIALSVVLLITTQR